MFSTHGGWLGRNRLNVRPALRTVARLALVGALAVTTMVTASAPAPVASSPSVNAVPGLITVSVSVTADSQSPKTATATCPGDTRVVGTGASIGGFGWAIGRVFIEAIIPMTRTVTARASEDEDGIAQNWPLHVYAICADPLPGLEIHRSSTASDSTDHKGCGDCLPAEQATRWQWGRGHESPRPGAAAGHHWRAVR